MFEVQIGDTNVGIKFEHFPLHRVQKTRTLCLVENKTESDIIYFGKSYCSHEDNFNKNTGRKIALTRAISSAPRPVRKLIWDAYFAARGHVD